MAFPGENGADESAGRRPPATSSAPPSRYGNAQPVPPAGPQPWTRMPDVGWPRMRTWSSDSRPSRTALLRSWAQRPTR